MNVLKPDKRATVETLLKNNVSQREISRRVGVDRKTIRKYSMALGLLPKPEDGEKDMAGQNPPPRPPVISVASGDIPFQARSACEPHRQWIEAQVREGRNAMAIYQELVETFSFEHRYNSVKRFVRGLKKKSPKQFDRLDFPPGEEAQVDYGKGAPTQYKPGKYRRPRLFVMTLKYSRRSFRKTVWKSSRETWARLHEEAFRYFGGSVKYVVLDNLKEGVVKPDIYEPDLNPLYAAVLKHYGTVADTARVRDADRKGTVENAIQHTQNTALKGKRFESIEEQNAWLMHWEDTWASKRIHGRMKRQVEEMFQEEKPHLNPLPLRGFRYFTQDTRTVYDDGTIQVDKSYYSALPAPLHQEVIVRIYAHEIEIIDPRTMETIRTHVKSARAGSVHMNPEDRIFNPSRQTAFLLAKAEKIGPFTRKFCALLFEAQGRPGQRRMQGVVNLARKYEVTHIEAAAVQAVRMGLRNYQAFRRLVEAKKGATTVEAGSGISQEHRLIRPAGEYGAFFDRHAAKANVVSRESLPRAWENADWFRVLAAFGLEAQKQHNDEVWIRSPFTGEKNASLHLHLKKNIYKDFSSGKGGGILNFCQDLLAQKGRVLNCYQVAEWMVEKGITSMVLQATGPAFTVNPPEENRPIHVDLRPFFQTRHEVLSQRGISSHACRYLGCGYLPERSEGNGSPLNGRLVFQVRGVGQEILSHVGRAMTKQQAEDDGRYWGYPFRKTLEIYNQDKLLVDPAAREQMERFGLLLVEGFFDLAVLVTAGCRNVGALMGAHLSMEQIARLKVIVSRAPFGWINLFLDRDETGRKGTLKAASMLRQSGFTVKTFDWNQKFERPGCPPVTIKPDINDPADMSIGQLKYLRKLEII